jgi:multicomponent Na+:H+ antiporter subunit C
MAMNALPLVASCAAVLMGLGLYALITDPEPLRKILAFNLLGSGVFLTFGVISRRAAAAGFGGDPVPQAMTITAIVVAFAATAMAIALVSRLVEAGGRAAISSDDLEKVNTDGGNS